MNKQHILLTAGFSSLLILVVLAGFGLILSRAAAAPASEANADRLAQTSSSDSQFISVSALAFEPVRQEVVYAKDVRLQMLSLASQLRNVNADAALFIAPLPLPDRALLVDMTVFGEDFDNLGEVGLRLKRCNHGQPFCVILAETTSTLAYNSGRFQTPSIPIQNEVVDNQFYSYFLELELTALGGSGLRSVRLALDPQSNAAGSRDENQWELADNVRLFQLPNTTLRQVRICAGDLGHLPNSTHLPYILADGQRISLFSGACETVWGSDIEIRRELNTGPSNGTYQFLR